MVWAGGCDTTPERASVQVKVTTPAIGRRAAGVGTPLTVALVVTTGGVYSILIPLKDAFTLLPAVSVQLVLTD